MPEKTGTNPKAVGARLQRAGGKPGDGRETDREADRETDRKKDGKRARKQAGGKTEYRREVTA